MTDNFTERPTGTMSALIFLVTSVVLFLGAIGIFIWLLVDATQEHFIKNILFGSAFLVCTLGLLIYVLFVYKAPRACSSILWTSMVLGAAAFIAGLCIPVQPCDHTPAPLPASEQLQ